MNLRAVHCFSRIPKAVLVLVVFTAIILLSLPSISWSETVVIAGTGASQDMLRSVAKSFMEEHSGVTIDIPDSTGSGGGIKAAASGDADAGRVSRKLKEKEAPLGLNYMPFARVPIVFVANSSIPPMNLTAGQTRDIFSGKVTNWKDVGGPDAKIRVLTRYDGDATIDTIRKYLEGWKDLEITKYSMSSDTDQDNVANILKYKDSAGFCNLGQALSAGLSIMSLDGVSPEDAGYPLHIEQAFVYKPAKMTGTLKAFIDYIFTPKAQKILKEAGATPVTK